MFVTIYQQWVINVLTDYHLCAAWNIIDVLGDENALSLGTRCGFDDPTFLRVLDHGILKANHLVR